MHGSAAKSSMNVNIRQAESMAAINGLANLRAMAIRGLARMYVPQEKVFVFRLRKAGGGIFPEGRSRRYTAIALIGLAGESRESVHQALLGHTTHTVCERIERDVEQVENLGDVALSTWAASYVEYPDRSRLWRRLEQLAMKDESRPVVELAWALAAACVDRKLDKAGLGERLAKRLMTSFSERSSVFPHVLGDAGSRSHVSCYADMVYPIHALSSYAQLSGDADALAIAAKCARKICEQQGAAGQWWWHYDRRTGDVIEGYPVYAIHQDAMGPMALFALKEAGGPDCSQAIKRGLDWLWYAPEIERSLIDEKSDLIWRKVARREPGKLARYAQATASRISPALRFPGLDTLLPPRAIDYEDRPYHLGWLLYAWPAARALKWDQSHYSL